MLSIPLGYGLTYMNFGGDPALRLRYVQGRYITSQSESNQRRVPRLYPFTDAPSRE